MQQHALQHNPLLHAAIVTFLATYQNGQNVPRGCRTAFINAHRSAAVQAVDTLEYEMTPTTYDTNWNNYQAPLRAAVADLYGIFGQQLPAAFYRVFAVLPTVGTFQDYRQHSRYLADNFRTLDAAVHAMALGTPLLMTVQAVFSRYGLQFVHLGNCGCCIEAYAGPVLPLPDIAKYGDRLFGDYLQAFLEQHIAFPQ